MKYWDASAVVPLLVAEEHTELARSWLQRDSAIVTREWTRVEITSAVERRFREALINRVQRRQLLQRLGDLAERWDEISAPKDVATQ